MPDTRCPHCAVSPIEDMAAHLPVCSMNPTPGVAPASVVSGDAERAVRLRLWVAGYRALMKGGNSSKVHTAGSRDSEMPDGSFAHLDVADVEWLLAAAIPAPPAAATRDALAKVLEDAWRRYQVSDAVTYFPVAADAIIAAFPGMTGAEVARLRAENARLRMDAGGLASDYTVMENAEYDAAVASLGELDRLKTAIEGLCDEAERTWTGPVGQKAYRAVRALLATEGETDAWCNDCQDSFPPGHAAPAPSGTPAGSGETT